LAGKRFSKEYISQIERGKTRPTGETVQWLSRRLGVDPGFLATGVSTDQRVRVETALARAEALSDSGDQAASVRAYEELEAATSVSRLPEFELRALIGHGKALIRDGEARDALRLLMRGRELAEAPGFSDVDRASAVFWLGVCRFYLSSVTTALGLLNQALELADRSELPCDQLRAEILHYRARCYLRQRDYEAAREDVERALELAEAQQDARTIGHLYFQASLLAERQGHWVLARSYAERAKAQYEDVADRVNIGRLLNNLGGLNFLLGKPNDAIRYLTDAFAALLEYGSAVEAAEVVSSLAQVHLRTGNARLAERHARQALELFGGKEAFGLGNAEIILGRALMEQGQLDEASARLSEAEKRYAALGSASHLASAWIAQGDLATRRGDDRAAAHLYRKAAEALQDIRF
jgi:tetratricopeptide (TPR) repeat protein